MKLTNNIESFLLQDLSGKPPTHSDIGLSETFNPDGARIVGCAVLCVSGH